MASLMFRAKVDNRYYAEAKKPKAPGSWYIFYYDLRGMKVRRRIGPNKRAAELAKGDIEARLAKQRAGLSLLDPDKELKRITLFVFKEQFPEFLQTENKVPKTIRRYCGVLGHLVAFIEDHEPYVRHLDQVEPHFIEEYKDTRRRQKITPNGHPNAPVREGVSVRTLNNELTFLQTIFNLAKRRGYITSNPFEEVRKINGQKRKKYHPMTEEQIQMLIGAADGKFRPILWTFLLTGMRTGELLDLEWEAVDFEREEVHIRSKTG